MSILSASQLAKARADMAATLTQPCTILSVTNQPAGAGEFRTTTTSASSTCSVSPLTAKESIQHERLQSAQGWSIKLPYETVITSADKIDTGGQVYEVIAVRASTDGLIRKALAVLVT